MKITQHFTLEELTASATARSRGIKNEPDRQAIINLTALCVAVLEPLRQWWGREVKIGSGYRCTKLNDAVGGVRNSQHMYGEAMDIRIDGVSANDLYSFLKKQPEVRYAYKINGTNVHFDIPKGKR